MSQALRRNDIADKFRQMTGKIEAALSEISYNKLEISEEVQEQVILLYIGRRLTIPYAIPWHFKLFPVIITCCAFKFL